MGAWPQSLCYWAQSQNRTPAFCTNRSSSLKWGAILVKDVVGYPHLGSFQLPSNAVLVVYPGNAMRPVSQDEMMRQVRCLLAFLWFIYMMQHTQSSNLIEIENWFSFFLTQVIVQWFSTGLHLFSFLNAWKSVFANLSG